MKHANSGLDYRTLMDDIEMPERVQEAVRDEVRQVRAAEARERSQQRGAHQRGVHRRAGQPVSRRRFVAGALVATCAIALGGTAAFSLFAKSNGNATSTSTNPAPSPTNMFALAAYASENPEGTPGKTVTLSLDDFGHDSSWKVWHSDPEIDPSHADEAPDEGRRYLSVANEFNLTCVGTNVASLTYEVEGDRVLFYTRTTDFRSNQDGPSSIIDRAKSFTVDYDEQHFDYVNTWRALRVSFPLEGELAELYDTVSAEFYDLLPNRNLDLYNALHVRLMRIYADALAQARLHLTATFKDGTTGTKTYVIAPVDNLEEALLAYNVATQAQMKLFQEHPEAHSEYIPRPQLFTLTELL